MKVYVQWTKRDAPEWEEFDVRGNVWRNQPKRPLPASGERGGLDNDPGYVWGLCSQGITYEGFDHYAVEPIAGSGIRVTVWNDDPDDFSDDERLAQVWELLPPAPDERIGGRVNTRQRLMVYAGDPARFPQSDIMAEPAKPWAEFSPPPAAVTRHGIDVADSKALEHRAVRSQHDWREWVS